jgi:hypothetical protein
MVFARGLLSVICWKKLLVAFAVCAACVQGGLQEGFSRAAELQAPAPTSGGRDSSPASGGRDSSPTSGGRDSSPASGEWEITPESAAAIEQGLVRGETVAGTGPIVHLTVTPGAEGALVADVRVDAPAWAGVDTIELRWGERTLAGPLDADGRARFLVPEGAPYLVALARGARARPGGDGEAWAVVGPLWLR